MARGGDPEDEYEADFVVDDDEPVDFDDDDSDDDLPSLADAVRGATIAGPRRTAARSGAGAGTSAARAAAPAGNGHRAAARRALGGAKSSSSRSAAARGKAKAPTYAWEANYKRSWDAVEEDESGSLAGAVKTFLDAAKRRRCVPSFRSVE